MSGVCFNKKVQNLFVELGNFLLEDIEEGEAGDHSRVPKNCLYHCLVRPDDHVKIEHHLDEKGKSIVKNKV